jgi:hypothetical protein
MKQNNKIDDYIERIINKRMKSEWIGDESKVTEKEKKNKINNG